MWAEGGTTTVALLPGANWQHWPGHRWVEKAGPEDGWPEMPLQQRFAWVRQQEPDPEVAKMGVREAKQNRIARHAEMAPRVTRLQ